MAEEELEDLVADQIVDVGKTPETLEDDTPGFVDNVPGAATESQTNTTAQSMGKIDWGKSPTPALTVDVGIFISVKAIHNIDTKTGITSLLAEFYLSWEDQRVLKALSDDSNFVIPTNVWIPDLNVVNAIDPVVRQSDVPIIRSDKKLYITFRLAGQIDNPMDLRRFPFDEDSIDMRFAPGMFVNEIFEYQLWAVNGSKSFDFTFERHLPEYQILGVNYREYDACIGIEKRMCPFFRFGINIRRKYFYYFMKVVLLMWLIVLLTMPTFLYEIEEVEQRMALTSTMFLATAATLYVVGQDLPKTENLNTMDKLILATLAVIFFVAAESITVFTLHKGNHIDAANRVQIISVVLLVAVYTILNVWLFVIPLVRLWRGGNQPSENAVDEGCEFVGWGKVIHNDPWGLTTSKTRIRRDRQECQTDQEMEFLSFL